MTNKLDIKIEDAIRLLVKNFPQSTAKSRKPILVHDIRVGNYLYENNYSDNIVLAGFLHDVIEWSKIRPQIIEETFNSKILKIVFACTKNRKITKPEERIEDLVQRCIKVGQDALIVKAADIIDSFKHYTKTKNNTELEYCRANKNVILKYKPKTFNDNIFKLLKKW